MLDELFIYYYFLLPGLIRMQTFVLAEESGWWDESRRLGSCGGVAIWGGSCEEFVSLCCAPLYFIPPVLCVIHIQS